MKKTKILASTKQGKYKLQMFCNEEVKKCFTDDIKKSIMELAPDVLKTRLRLKVEKDGKVCERLYTRPRGRLLLKQDVMLRVFINKLIFK